MREDMTAPFLGGVDGETGLVAGAPGQEEIARLFEGLRPAIRRDVIGNPFDLVESGWAIVFAQSDERAAAILEALEPLLRLRRRQAGDRYHQLSGDGYRENESRLDFLTRQETGPGRVDPSIFPYYVLLVGSPEEIPYEFQYELDVHHAVGRLCFDSIAEYASYASGVAAAEALRKRPAYDVAFFGPDQDEGTRLSNEALLSPVIEKLRHKRDCRVRDFLGKAATKAQLAELLGTSLAPDLLFTAGHGLFYKPGHERQRTHQGALVCQDWLGPGWVPEPDHYFAAQDVQGGPHLRGLVAFFFACNSAGTPELRDFAPEDGALMQAAPRPFVAQLAHKLLGNPKGGALALVGHVERVWRCSFLWRSAGSQPQPYIEMLERLLDGAPLGWALEPINQRYADLAAALSYLLANHYLGLSVDAKALADLWTETHDARNYVVIGDPAVRLFSAAGPAPKPPVTRGSV